MPSRMSVRPEENAAPSLPAGTARRRWRSSPTRPAFAATRSELMAALTTPRSDCFRRIIALIRDALPGVEVAVLAPDGGRQHGGAGVGVGGRPSPALPGRALRPDDPGTVRPGRQRRLGGGHLSDLRALDGEAVGAIAARPAGMLGNEGVGLLGETARLLGLRWREIGRDGRRRTGLGTVMRVRRSGAQIPGTSQAVQVLRAGMVAAAIGNEPVLVCGGEGVGRTEMARLLSTVGPGRGRPVVVVEGGGADDGAVRRELFGPTGVPSLADRVEGAVDRARGGVPDPAQRGPTSAAAAGRACGLDLGAAARAGGRRLGALGRHLRRGPARPRAAGQAGTGVLPGASPVGCCACRAWRSAARTCRC